MEALLALVVAIPIGVLGGLIGLGGAEFRLPVLVGLFKRSARQAVPINLAISLITLITSLVIRLRVLPDFPYPSLLTPISSLIFGGVIFAFVGAGLISQIPVHRLEALIRYFLVMIGVLLLTEGLFSLPVGHLLQNSFWVQGVVGVVCGAVIGIVSSTLGVAGGELIIPTLIFIFGIDVKLAGTASLMVSLPTVATGILRYARRGMYQERREWFTLITPMGAGSVVGAVLGGVLMGMVSGQWLKVILGLVLIISAIRMFMHHHQSQNNTTEKAGKPS